MEPVQFESKEEKGWDDLFKQNKKIKQQKAKNLLKNLIYGAEPGGSWAYRGVQYFVWGTEADDRRAVEQE